MWSSAWNQIPMMRYWHEVEVSAKCRGRLSET